MLLQDEYNAIFWQNTFITVLYSTSILVLENVHDLNAQSRHHYANMRAHNSGIAYTSTHKLTRIRILLLLPSIRIRNTEKVSKIFILFVYCGSVKLDQCLSWSWSSQRSRPLSRSPSSPPCSTPSASASASDTSRRRWTSPTAWSSSPAPTRVCNYLCIYYMHVQYRAMYSTCDRAMSGASEIFTLILNITTFMALQ